MNKVIQILGSADELEIPECPAVYAIFSHSKCRFVGKTDDLHKTIVEHFKPTEPNVSLRYFMQSVKPKILQYEILPTASIADREIIMEKWITLLRPSDN